MKSRLCFAFFIAMALHPVVAHESAQWTFPSLEWKTDQIEQALASQVRKVTVQGNRCFVGRAFYFKVQDSYAFDIDETVRLDVRLQTSPRSKLKVIYDGPLGMQ